MKKGEFILVTYDIIEDKRRQKIAEILEDYGERVQYSVFECFIDKEHFETMKERICQVMEEKEDKVNFYILCESCALKSQYLGVQEIQKEPEVYIV